MVWVWLNQLWPLPMFIYWNNHFLFYWKSFCFSHKSLRWFPSSLNPGPNQKCKSQSDSWLIQPWKQNGHILFEDPLLEVQQFYSGVSPPLLIVLFWNSHSHVGEWQDCLLEKRGNWQVDVLFIVQLCSGERCFVLLVEIQA